ncbi:MAG: hypothetical protein IJS28_07445 [Synergistaceae bacterium]|nr:hypothetical protein [Synergistaceae bacterium]
MANECKTVKINLKTAPHERLGGLLGGDDGGHYHLSEEEYGLVSELVEERRLENEAGGCFHKLQDDEHDKLLKLLDIFFPDEEADIADTFATLMDARIAAYIKTIDSGEITAPNAGG